MYEDIVSGIVGRKGNFGSMEGGTGLTGEKGELARRGEE